MLRTAFYEKEITPPLGCAIPGYFELRLGSDVKDRLYAKAMVAENNGTAVAVVAIDGCTNDDRLTDLVCRRIEEFVGIPRSHVTVAFNHTHCGIPRADYSKDPRAVANMEGYISVASKLIADCVILAYYRLSDSELRFAQGAVEGIAFCRDYYMKNGTPQTNPGVLNPNIDRPVAKNDPVLPVLFACDKAGNPKGVLVAFDCHLDCVGGDAYTGDYPAELSRILKKEYGEDFVTVFLEGVAGDVNHKNVNRKFTDPNHYKHMARLLADELLAIAPTAQPLVGDAVEAVFERVPIARRHIPEEDIAEAREAIATIQADPATGIRAMNRSDKQYVLGMAKRLIGFLENTPEIMEVPLQVLKLGDFRLYGFPSEIFSCHGKRLRQGAGFEKKLVCTLANGSFGYVVAEDMFYDTVYESRPGSNRLCAEAGRIMADKLMEMGK